MTRVLPIFISIVMCITIMPLTAFATEGVIDDSGEQVEAAEPIYVYTVEDLFGDNTANYVLMNDLDLEGNEKFFDNYFGILDGNGYKLANVKRPIINNNYGTIKNLNFELNIQLGTDEEGNYILEKNEYHIGGVCNTNYGLISNCFVDGIIYMYAYEASVAAVAETNYGIIEKVINKANIQVISFYLNDKHEMIKPNEGYVGGISCFSPGKTQDNAIRECVNIGNALAVNATYKFDYAVSGGIVAEGKNIFDCVNRGAVVAIGDEKAYGGIVGKGGNVKNCINLTGIEYAIAHEATGDITNCYYPEDDDVQAVYDSGDYIVDTTAFEREEYNKKETFKDFDFDNVWISIKKGYDDEEYDLIYLRAEYYNDNFYYYDGDSEEVSVSYHTHIQSYGDTQAIKKNGEMSGTSGEAKRLEDIWIKVEGVEDLGIQYTTHCQSYGWLPWSADGERNGTSGEGKRLEAIKIRLSGLTADDYDVYYRVHAQSYGWLGWAKNGQPSGTAGLGKRLEGIQVVVVKRGEEGPGLDYGEIKASTLPHDERAYISVSDEIIFIPGNETTANVSYRTHVQSYGWQKWKHNGEMSGTSGEAKRLEGINIKLTNKDYEGGIAYTTHVQTYGWQGDENDSSKWMTDGHMSGTSGEAKRLEAIKIKLTGEIANYYDIYYRVHAQSYGWLGWAKNGEPSGTAGYAKRLEGIQIVLVPKGGAAPTNHDGVVSTRTEAYITK